MNDHDAQTGTHRLRRGPLISPRSLLAQVVHQNGRLLRRLICRLPGPLNWAFGVLAGGFSQGALCPLPETVVPLRSGPQFGTLKLTRSRQQDSGAAGYR